MQRTYPETTTFRWEGDQRYLVTQAVEFLDDMAAQGGSKARQAACRAAARALEEISETKDKPHFTGDQMKLLLVAAAQEHGWWERKKREMPDLTAPEGMKVCFRCTKTHLVKEFEVKPSAAKARSYGWKPDTTQKIVGPLCSVCRKAKADEAGRKRQRRLSRKKLDTLSPEASKVFKQYSKLKLEIAEHLGRIRAAHSRVKAVLKDPDGTGDDMVVYHFASTDLRDFYNMKRTLLIDARDRLEQRMADAAPLPATWGMLLTPAEQNNLASLHTHACMGNTRNLPSLWKAVPRAAEAPLLDESEE
jgi:hypothetical protein